MEEDILYAHARYQFQAPEAFSTLAALSLVGLEEKSQPLVFIGQRLRSTSTRIRNKQRTDR
jgi:hypothetical protein